MDGGGALDGGTTGTGAGSLVAPPSALSSGALGAPMSGGAAAGSGGGAPKFVSATGAAVRASDQAPLRKLTTGLLAT
jgi:hypothetical protein